MAEREGFEPSVECYPNTRFPSVRIRPLCHLSEIRALLSTRPWRGRQFVSVFRRISSQKFADVRFAFSDADFSVPAGVWKPLVRGTGLEPATPRPPALCATNCATPWFRTDVRGRHYLQKPPGRKRKNARRSLARKSGPSRSRHRTPVPEKSFGGDDGIRTRVWEGSPRRCTHVGGLSTRRATRPPDGPSRDRSFFFRFSSFRRKLLKDRKGSARLYVRRSPRAGGSVDGAAGLGGPGDPEVGRCF